MITRQDLEVMRGRGYRRYGRQADGRPRAWARMDGAIEYTIHIQDRVALNVTRYSVDSGGLPYGSFTYTFSSVHNLLALELSVVGGLRTMLEFLDFAESYRAGRARLQEGVRGAG